MTAKEYLSRARDIDKQIDIDMLEACRLRSLAERVTASFTHDRVQSGDQRSKVEDAAIKLVELEGTILDSIQELVAVKREIWGIIDRLKKPEERAVLKLRYISGKRWEQIAVDMNYSWRQVHYIHKSALKNIAHYCT